MLGDPDAQNGSRVDEVGLIDCEEAGLQRSELIQSVNETRAIRGCEESTALILHHPVLDRQRRGRHRRRRGQRGGREAEAEADNTDDP